MKQNKNSEYEISKTGNYSQGKLFKWIWFDYLRQYKSLIILVILLMTISFFAFLEIKPIVELLEIPVTNIRFFQLSPGEYFISTVKISFYTGLLFGSPFAIGQLILFLLPGLTKKETKIKKKNKDICVIFLL